MLINKAKLSFFNRQKGFTLIEMIVVIVILALLLGLAIYAYQNSRNKTKLKTAAEILVNDLRRVQNMTISGETREDINENTHDVPEGGYGIHLETDEGRYELFQDLGDFSSPGNEPNGIYDPFIDEQVKVVDLYGGLKILRLEGETDAYTYGGINIVFPPPNLIPLSIKSDRPPPEFSGDSIEIILGFGAGGAERGVIIYKESGNIEITNP